MSRKVLPSGGDNIIDMTVEINTDTGEVIFKNQIEIEALALAVVGAREDIYSEEIPIGDNIILRFDDNYFRGWILETLNSDCI